MGKAVGHRRYSRSLFQRYSSLICTVLFLPAQPGAATARPNIRPGALHSPISLADSGSQSANEMLLNWVCVLMLRTIGQEDVTQQRFNNGHHA